ncbi:MAG: hypothetical protein WBY94_21455 [Polyangiaceae bacterium]
MTKMRVGHWFFAAAVICSFGTASPRTAFAEPGSEENLARARELFSAATEQRDAGDARGALSKFQAAHELADNPITAVELGRTYVLLNMLVEACAMFDSVADMHRSPAAETPRSVQARHDAAQLSAEVGSRVPHLTVKIRGLASNVVVTLDRTPVPVSRLAGPLAVNPGIHNLSAMTSTGARVETDLNLVEGESRKVELTVPANSSASVSKSELPARSGHLPVALPSAPANPPTRVGGTTPLVYAGFGVGAVGFVVGGIAGALAVQKVSGLQASCQSVACIPAVNDGLESARTLGYVATISLVAAGAGVAAGIAGLLLGSPSIPSTTTGKPASAGAWASLGIGGIQGSF